MLEAKHIVIFITAKDQEEAKNIGQHLLEHKLAACVNVLSNVQSMFWWEAKIDHANEALLIVKSQKALFLSLVKAVKDIHSYDVPEIIALPIIDGNEQYLQWVDESVK